ncbi:ras-related protein Rab-32 [Coregonus clupeaformis]|uniref:ras-related protein Rab-32 n=1 Tax=Coregonus clupeaformis TaxID=59861 RepID=UPI001BDF80D4|nr:ras-related protein Rab-32 [Coregonus clupeaformis]
MAGGSVSVCTECLFKVLVIGERGAGKTSFITRYVNMRFKEEYKASIGVDFALKTIEWDNKTVVRLQLWDIAGQERIRNMTRLYYKEAMGAFVVFDMTKIETLEAASQWKHDLDSKVRLASGSPIPAVLLANKCDLTEGNKELSALMDNYCKEKGFLGWFETSAKDNLNVDEAGAFLVENMLRIDRGLSSRDNKNDRINMRQSKETFQCC